MTSTNDEDNWTMCEECGYPVKVSRVVQSPSGFETVFYVDEEGLEYRDFHVHIGHR